MNKSQLQYYIENQDNFVHQYNGHIIAVKDGVCLGQYDTMVDAARDMTDHGLKGGEFLIIRCTLGDSEYTAYFANYWQPNPVSVGHA